MKNRKSVYFHKPFREKATFIKTKEREIHMNTLGALIWFGQPE